MIYAVAENGGSLEELLNPEFSPEQMQLIADVQTRTDAIHRSAADDAVKPLTSKPMTPEEVNQARKEKNLPLDTDTAQKPPAQPKQEPINFHITDNDLGAGGAKTKFKANIEAIRLLQTLDAQKEQEQPFVKQFYVVENLQAAPLRIEQFGNLDDAMSQYQELPNHYMKALGVEKNPDPLPGSLDVLQCRNGIDTIVEDYKTVPGWDNPYIQNHVVQPLQVALAVQDVELAYELPDAYFHIQTCDDGFDYTLYNKDFTVMDGGIVETDEYRPVLEVMEEVLAEHGHSISECGVISAEYLQEQSYRAETQRAEAMKEKLAAEKPAPEASISFYVAECAEFPVMGEFYDNLTLEQALEVYDKIPAERMNGIKSIGFSLEDGSIYSGMFDLMVGGEVQAEVVNHIQHYRESPLVQKAISDMKTLLEKRQASKELEERPNTRQSVREALKNRKKAQEQQSNQEQAKPKKAKKKGEMEL